MGYKFLNDFNLYSSNRSKINYIVEKANWSIRWDGEYISNNINNKSKELITLSSFPVNIFNRIVHFGSHYMWLNWESHLSKSNKYIVTYFHGKPDDGKIAKEQVNHFIKSSSSIDIIVTAASLIEKRLITWGIPEEKIIKIPLGVDTKVFSPVLNHEKERIRKNIGIPSDYFVIGSFQKDGVGWGRGAEPKYIKGPDIFIKTIEKLSNNNKIFVLLTGPARGYVKKELDRINIPYIHNYVNSYSELVNYYRALDLYIVAAREEGGPKAILESMATGIPIVSTNVGMASDVISNGVNGYIASVDDYMLLSDLSAELLDSKKKREDISSNALGLVQEYDWKNIADQYYKKVYLPLLKNIII